MSQLWLQTAHELVNGERAKSYGHPRENFLAIATMWEAYLAKRGLFNENSQGLEPRDVGCMMILLKIARDANSPSDDNMIDIAGYVAAIERLLE